MPFAGMIYEVCFFLWQFLQPGCKRYKDCDFRQLFSWQHTLKFIQQEKMLFFLFPKESEALLPTQCSNNWCASYSVNWQLFFHIQNQRKDWCCHYIDQLSSNWVESESGLYESCLDNFRYLFFPSLPSVSLSSFSSVFSTHICSLSSYIRSKYYVVNPLLGHRTNLFGLKNTLTLILLKSMAPQIYVFVGYTYCCVLHY